MMNEERTHDDDELDAAIALALEPYAADADAFAAGVRDRIGQRREESHRPLPRFVTHAAGLLPPVMLPAGLAQTVSGAGKSFAWKFLPGVVALPAIVLLMVFATFFYGVRRQPNHGEARHDADQARAEVFGWWRRNLLTVAGVVALLVVLARLAPTDAVLAFCGVSIAALIGIFGALARRGYATRQEVGRRCAGFLIALLPYGIMARSLLDQQAVSLRALWALLLAAFVCFVLAAGDLPRWGRRSAIALASVFGIFMGVLLALLPTGRVPAHRSDAVAFVERAPTTDWNKLGGIVLHLRADGGAPPDLIAARQRFHRWADAARAERGDGAVNPLMVRDVESLGFLRDVDHAPLRTPYTERYVLQMDTPMRTPTHDVYKIAAVGAAHRYTEAEIDTLMARVVAGLPPPTATARLEDLVAVLSIFDRHGHPELAERLRAHVRRTLLATWTGRPGAKQACFAPAPQLVERDAGGVPVDRRLTFVWLDATDLALRLLARFGVPDGIDLTALDAYLTEQARHYPGSDRSWSSLAAAMRSHLRSWPQWHAAEPAALTVWLLRERVFLGALLLSLFCVLVTWRSPRANASAVRPRYARRGI